jgi:hypothetical protein
MKPKIINQTIRWNVIIVFQGNQEKRLCKSVMGLRNCVVIKIHKYLISILNQKALAWEKPDSNKEIKF